MANVVKVLYDITTLANIHCAPNVQPSGIYKHTEEMGRALRDAPGLELYLSSKPSQFRKAFRYLADTHQFELDRFLLTPSELRNCIPYVYSAQLSSSSIQSFAEQYHRDNYDAVSICNQGKIDIYHVNWRGESSLPSEIYSQIVLTIYDVIALKQPEWFVNTGQENSIGEYLSALLHSVSPKHSITVSTESVKNDLLSMFLHLSEDQIYVTPLGVSEHFRPVKDIDAINCVKEKYGIPQNRRYALCVNTIEPRKNMESVIRSFSLMYEDRKFDDVCLVLAGSKGWLYEDVELLTEKMSKEQGCPIYVTGYVDYVDLPYLYSGASVFCYPSLDEGFGLPVLEAMRCGTPVVTSDIAPLREVAGAGAMLVDPTDTIALADAISELLGDRSLSRVLAASGEKWARSFSWERSASEMCEVYEHVVQKHL